MQNVNWYCLGKNIVEGCLSSSGHGCSKLTTSLVNVSLKFQTLISRICQYFLLKKNVKSFCTAKASLIFSAKNISVFGYKVIKHLMSWPLNELDKLTMLWTTGPRFLEMYHNLLVALLLYYTGRFFHCYMLDESICHVRGTGSIFSNLSYFLWEILLANN